MREPFFKPDAGGSQFPRNSGQNPSFSINTYVNKQLTQFLHVVAMTGDETADINALNILDIYWVEPSNCPKLKLSSTVDEPENPVV